MWGAKLIYQNWKEEGVRAQTKYAEEQVSDMVQDLGISADLPQVASECASIAHDAQQVDHLHNNLQTNKVDYIEVLIVNKPIWPMKPND